MNYYDEFNRSYEEFQRLYKEHLEILGRLNKLGLVVVVLGGKVVGGLGVLADLTDASYEKLRSMIRRDKMSLTKSNLQYLARVKKEVDRYIQEQGCRSKRVDEQSNGVCGR